MNAIPFCRRAWHPRQRGTHFVQVGQRGACVDLLWPDWSPVTLEDLAWSLSRLARFNGGGSSTYPLSVAQHSANVSAAVFGMTADRKLAAAALLHDAHEAALGDIVAPVKAALSPALQVLEGRLQATLLTRFGLVPELARHPALHRADAEALATERRDLLPESVWPWRGPAAQAWPEKTVPWPASVAYARFLAMAGTVGLG